MQTVLPSEFKRGMVLLLDGAPQVLEEFHMTGTAQTKHKLHGRVRDLKSGRLSDRTFVENERLPVADVHNRRVQFSYQQGDTYVFMDAQNFEQLELPADRVRDRRFFLKENEDYKAVFLDGKVLDLELPGQMALEVTETAPPTSGGSDAAWKTATLETGLEIMVPLFIARGENIRVDTQQKKYVGRHNEGT